MGTVHVENEVIVHYELNRIVLDMVFAPSRKIMEQKDAKKTVLSQTTQSIETCICNTS